MNLNADFFYADSMVSYTTYYQLSKENGHYYVEKVPVINIWDGTVTQSVIEAELDKIDTAYENRQMKMQLDLSKEDADIELRKFFVAHRRVFIVADDPTMEFLRSKLVAPDDFIIKPGTKLFKESVDRTDTGYKHCAATRPPVTIPTSILNDAGISVARKIENCNLIVAHNNLFRGATDALSSDYIADDIKARIVYTPLNKIACYVYENNANGNHFPDAPTIHLHTIVDFLGLENYVDLMKLLTSEKPIIKVNKWYNIFSQSFNRSYIDSKETLDSLIELLSSKDSDTVVLGAKLLFSYDLMRTPWLARYLISEYILSSNAIVYSISCTAEFKYYERILFRKTDNSRWVILNYIEANELELKIAHHIVDQYCREHLARVIEIEVPSNLRDYYRKLIGLPPFLENLFNFT